MRVQVDGQIYTFDEGRFLNVEFMAIEKVTGLTPVEWQDGLNRGSSVALTALVWILRKRHDNPAMAFDDVVFDFASFDLVDEAETEGKEGTPTESESPEPVVESSIPITT